MWNSLIGKPKNWLDGLYKGVEPYEKIEIVKKEDFVPEAPVKMMAKKQIAEAIEEMREAIDQNGKAIWLTISGAYEIDYNYNPPRVTKIEEE